VPLDLTATTAGDVAFRGRLLLGALIGILITTILMAISQDYTHLLIFKVLNGLCMGLLVPPLQSVIGDLHDAGQRGKAFGYLTFTGIIGAIIGSAVATILAAGVFWGIDGWRVAMFVWAAFLLLVIGGLWFFAIEDLDKIDARKVEHLQELEETPWYNRGGPLIKEAYERSVLVLSIPTLQVLLVPMAVGGIPWMAFTAWVTYYLEALGFSNAVTALLILTCGTGFACGAFFGGMIGDWADSMDRVKYGPAARRIFSLFIPLANASAGVLLW
jgi:MFS family permease